MNYFPLVNFSYYVLKGDTLFDLSKRYNSSIEEILKANPGLKIDNLIVGQLINIPLHQEFVNKINQIHYSISTTKYEFARSIHSLINKHHLYTHLLILDVKSHDFKINHLDNYLSFGKQLQTLIVNSIKVDVNLEVSIEAYLASIVELFKIYPKYDVNKYDSLYKTCLSKIDEVALSMASLNKNYRVEEIKMILNTYQQLIVKELNAIMSQDYESYDLLYDKVDYHCNLLANMIIELYPE
jgi:LysM repeat protein